jgi:hypothetical protein
MPEPIKINRMHWVWPSHIRKIERVLMSEPSGWLEVITKDGNRYQTELSDKPDPECPVDPDLLCRELVKLTGIQPTVTLSIDSEADADAWVARIMARQVTFPVEGADGVKFSFLPGMSCGTDPDHNPGISFTFHIDGDEERRLRFGRHMAMGACCNIGRANAKRLADMIYEFLQDPGG